MEPRIQYAKTSDGVSIAFYTLGEGRPLVHMPNIPWSHIQLEWQHPRWRRWYELLAQNRMLVRYDARGAGLSDRDVSGFSLDAYVLDLEAVVDRLGLDKLALFVPGLSGPVGIAYVARHPERVSRLVLWCSWARASDYFQRPQVQTLAALRDKDWEIYTEATAHAILGWSAAREARAMAVYMRECLTQEAARAAHEAIQEFDVADQLPRVRSPTLVVHRQQFQFPPVDAARDLASKIPDARLVVLEGASPSWLVDTEAVVAAVNEFLDEGEPVAAPVPPAATVHTILFTDVEGSTALTQRLGDAKAREVLREHERIVREALKAHGGSEVKTMGDGFMASFASATRALECAIAIQRAFAAWNASLPGRPEALEGRAEPQPSAHGSRNSPRAGGDVGSPSEAIRVRIGLNAGEPIAEEADLFGTAVIRAARIAAMAQGGEILVANVVRELVEGKGFLFGDRGDAALRGFEDPVRLFEVHWRE